MASVRHDSALEEAAAALNLKGVKMSDILAATDARRRRSGSRSYHRSAVGRRRPRVDGADGRKLERKKTMRELAQEEAVEA